MNKYHAQKTYIESLGRTFDSKAEAQRAVDLSLMEREGLICGLIFQIPFVLSEKPKKTITIDFSYVDISKFELVYEDVKGVLTRDFKTKLLWFKEKYGIDVKLVDKHGRER